MYMLFLNSHVYLRTGGSRNLPQREPWATMYTRVITGTTCGALRDGAAGGSGRGASVLRGQRIGGICRFNTDIDDMTRFSDDGAAISAVWATKADATGT
jgi:hypothetical protein